MNDALDMNAAQNMPGCGEDSKTGRAAEFSEDSNEVTVSNPPHAIIEAAADFAAVPDGFERLWTPHRMAYIHGDHKPETPAAGKQCPFCAAPDQDDAASLIVARGKHVFALLNLFPYNSGHLLVCPYRHVADYTDLTKAETLELAVFAQTAMRVIRATIAPQGFNLGMNQGDIAGAGIAAHLHQHIVPRWAGDMNFFPIIAQTKAMPELLADTRATLAAAWPPLDEGAGDAR